MNVPVGYYTEVMGLGASPDDTRIAGNVHADASLPNNNATTTFWRAAEDFSVTPPDGNMQWAVSQAVPLRRMHIAGNLVLHQDHGWASGGWMSDDLVDGNVDSGSPAAMDLEELRVGYLDGLELEHGFCRRGSSACG